MKIPPGDPHLTMNPALKEGFWKTVYSRVKIKIRKTMALTKGKHMQFLLVSAITAPHPYIFPSFPSFRKSSPLLQQPMGLGAWNLVWCEVYLSMYITSFQSVCPPHGQWPAPMGSWRVWYSSKGKDWFDEQGHPRSRLNLVKFLSNFGAPYASFPFFWLSYRVDKYSLRQGKWKPEME